MESSLHNIRLTSFDVVLSLEVTKNVAEVNVEKLAVSLNHIVSRVAVTDSHDIGGDQVTCTGADKVLLGNFVLVFVWVHIPQVFVGGFVVKGFHQVIRVLFVDVGAIFGILDYFDEADTIPCW